MGRPKLKRRFWTAEDLDQVRQWYPVEDTEAIAQRLGRTVLAVYDAAGKLRITKTAEYIAAKNRIEAELLEISGAMYRFRPGQVPVNKGVRQPGWGPGRMKETQFKKGNLSGFAAATIRPIGTILADNEGFYRIKVREREPDNPRHVGWSRDIWPQLSHLVWEQHHGHIPPSHNIIFKDRDRSNCTIENLECVSRADMARRNAMWGRYPQPLALAIQMNGALKRRLRRLANAEQNDGPTQSSL